MSSTYSSSICHSSDERKNPDDIPEYKLVIRGWIVMCSNYSFLWQYLEPSRLLPTLVDKLLMTETAKKEAESYTQKFAQNAVIIKQLFSSDCPPLKLCDTLDVTGQGHIAKKLMQGTHCQCRMHLYELFSFRFVFCIGIRG